MPGEDHVGSVARRSACESAVALAARDHRPRAVEGVRQQALPQGIVRLRSSPRFDALGLGLVHLEDALVGGLHVCGGDRPRALLVAL